ncbi:hypothetical protein [Mycobacterium montefiorense]|uniref:hypothetical protein n=1 Tax=Mycobacterium montefiorense TaxID=154654 RepID=UPI000D58D36D|nr:hypothetical protein [Mycobacterium montefiorense]
MFRHQTRAESERSNLFHRMLRDAIADGEAQRAGSLMAEHIMQGRDGVLALGSHTRAESETHAS